ncbi:MAG: glycosyltransferase [bacterium]
MKITIISTAYPLRGGIAQYSGILYNKLKEQKHEVSVVTFKRQYPEFLFPGKTQKETSELDSIKIESEPIIDSINPLSWINVCKKIRRHKPDLIIFNYWMPFFAPCFGSMCWFTKIFTKTKVLYICHNIIPHERRLGDVALTKFAFKKADYFIVLSEVVKQQLLELFPNACYRKIPHPVFSVFGEAIDKNKAKKEIGTSGQRVILFFGYIRAYKGLDLILKAMPEIVKELNVKLAVVGEFYDHEQKYRKLIKELGIERNVLIHAEFIPNEKVSLYFCAADVVVLPYRSATQSGIVPLAYHFGRPCIVTDVGGLAEVVIHSKTGFVVKADDPRELADAVIRFYLENKEQEFSKNVKEEKKKYSWENVISAIEGFVNSRIIK